MKVKHYKQMHRIFSTTPDSVEQLGYVLMEVYGYTYEQVDSMDRFRFTMKVDKLKRAVERKEPKWPWRIRFEEDATKLTFGQFIECQYWLQQGELPLVLDLVAASIMRDRTDHKADAQRINELPIHHVLAPVNRFAVSLEALVQSYSGLFDKDDVQEEEEEDLSSPQMPSFGSTSHPFVEQYGWIFSATTVAQHEGLRLMQAFQLPVIQALNDMAYLKSKRKFDEWIAKKKR